MNEDTMLSKPSIVIGVVDELGCEAIIREIRAGIEEEGVPYALLKGEVGDAVALAWQAANSSRLGVGVGISPTDLCIHHHKFPVLEPLFTSATDGDPAQWRQFGYNAARLVKGLPFKDNVVPGLTLDLDEAQLVQQVHQLVKKILQELAHGHGEVSR